MHKYHGSNKIKDRAKLADFDIVFTTYHTLAAEYSRANRELISIMWYRTVLDEGNCIFIHVPPRKTNDCKLTSSVTRLPHSSKQPQHCLPTFVGVLLVRQYRTKLKTFLRWFVF
jgi:hypothetical protein